MMSFLTLDIMLAVFIAAGTSQARRTRAPESLHHRAEKKWVSASGVATGVRAAQGGAC